MLLGAVRVMLAEHNIVEEPDNTIDEEEDFNFDDEFDIEANLDESRQLMGPRRRRLYMQQLQGKCLFSVHTLNHRS